MQWYYAVDDDRRGPVDEGSLSTLIGSGVVTRSSLVWRSGMGDWKAAGNTELSRYFGGAQPPPPPPRPSVLDALVVPSPYAPPATMMPSGVPGEIEPRNVAMMVVLLLVTLGLYALYLLYAWSDEVNRVSGTRRFSGVTTVLVTIFTCGLAVFAYLPMFAFALQAAAARREVPDRLTNLGNITVGLEIGGFVLGLATAGVSSLVTWPLTLALIQLELNKLALQPAPAFG